MEAVTVWTRQSRLRRICTVESAMKAFIISSTAAFCAALYFALSVVETESSTYLLTLRKAVLPALQSFILMNGLVCSMGRTGTLFQTPPTQYSKKTEKEETEQKTGWTSKAYQLSGSEQVKRTDEKQEVWFERVWKTSATEPVTWMSLSSSRLQPPKVASRVWSYEARSGKAYEIVMFLLNLYVKEMPGLLGGSWRLPLAGEFKRMKAVDSFPSSTWHMLSDGMNLMSGFGKRFRTSVLVSLLPTMVDAGEKHCLKD
ncbi:Hypothetical_protein [Hexamita inflata]|uniref:Hypothetical_protein n=1 Tax=Hexamita inflata TaxID=28002 RepID=A0AA86QBY5_9EUKA|nr:Hypothetical protein HINF_LOCUS44059 [Hexamita inflata]